jgi:hypothetical protein
LGHCQAFAQQASIILNSSAHWGMRDQAAVKAVAYYSQPFLYSDCFLKNLAMIPPPHFVAGESEPGSIQVLFGFRSN